MKRIFSLIVLLVFCLVAFSVANGLGEMDTSADIQEYEDLQKFKDLNELLHYIEDYYIRDVDEQELLNSAAKGMLEYLKDDKTFFYSPEEIKRLFEDETDMVGIGIQINTQAEEGNCIISRLFPDSPAQKAGIRKGDILFKVDGYGPVTPENMQEAGARIRGTEGTQVVITVLRDNEQKEFTITRARIDTNPVVSKTLTKDIGYIAFSEITGNCSEQFEEDIDAFLKTGVRGIIIDMRDNQGGWIDETIKTADLFLDKDVIGGYVFKDGSVDNTGFDTKDGKYEVRVAIIANESTSGVSELFISALQERAQAKVVGTRTRGDGLIAYVYDFGTTGAKFQISVAELMNIKNEKIEGNGIIPDIEVASEGTDESDIQLQRAIEVMEELLASDSEQRGK